MNKLHEIVSAWAKSMNPSDQETELANLRYDICRSCPKREVKIGYELCGECGCPLDKKIFSPNRDRVCPLNKWSEIDKKFS